MATSQRLDTKIESNRANAKKSPGPIDKTRTKLSALSHGLLAIGITQLDDLKAYRKLVRELKEQMNPVGALENFLLEAVALDLVRWPRARRFESQYITEILVPSHDPLTYAESTSFLQSALNPHSEIQQARTRSAGEVFGTFSGSCR